MEERNDKKVIEVDKEIPKARKAQSLWMKIIMALVFVSMIAMMILGANMGGTASKNTQPNDMDEEQSAVNAEEAKPFDEVLVSTVENYRFSSAGGRVVRLKITEFERVGSNGVRGMLEFFTDENADSKEIASYPFEGEYTVSDDSLLVFDDRTMTEMFNLFSYFSYTHLAQRELGEKLDTETHAIETQITHDGENTIFDLSCDVFRSMRYKFKKGETSFDVRVETVDIQK